MRSILNNDHSVELAGETHYFDDLRVKLGGARALDEGEQRACEDYFLALAHRPYGHSGDASRSSMDRAQLATLAGELGGTADAFFEAYCRLHAAEQKKTRWGEKTPRHIYRLPEILTTYPDAQAICMVRDPRAVVASYRDWKNLGGFDLEKDPGHEEALEQDQDRVRRSYHPLIIAFLWKGTVGAARAALQRFGSSRVRIVRYEDVVRSPAVTVRALAEWLGIAFTERLLDVPMHNSSFSRFDVAGGVSTAPLDRWRQKLGPSEIALVQDACADLLTDVGYERLDVSASLASRAWAWGSLPLASLRALRANRSRMGNVPRYLVRRLRSLLAARS